MKYLLSSLSIFLSLNIFAQDTIVIQTLTFEDITKRRDSWTFPSTGESFRKVLMYYTLKCDPATTADQFACGEWDYLTYTQLYDHDATYDSTYQSHPAFLVNGSARDSFSYTDQTVYQYERETLSGLEHQQIISLDSAIVGVGSLVSDFPLNEGKTGSKAYILISADDLSDAGLDPGPITGLRLHFDFISPASSRLVEIGLAGTSASTVESAEVSVVSFQRNYRYLRQLDGSGWKDFQFNQSFNWNGTDNLLLYIATDGSSDSAPFVLNGDIVQGQTLRSEGDNFALDLTNSQTYVDLGMTAQQSGNNARTIEMWAYASAFNGGGIFQAGPTGSTNRDFSLRTMGTDELWRVQLWGSGDFDITLTGSKDSWHHYALVYTGSTVQLYYDGQLVRSSNVPLNTGEHDIWIGRWANSFFEGKIDEVRIWDTALNSGTISSWRSRKLDPSHPFYSSLSAYYTFDEGEGFMVEDQSAAAQSAGSIEGVAYWIPNGGSGQYNQFVPADFRPRLMLEQGEYVSDEVSLEHTDSTLARPFLLERFDNPANGRIIDDEAADHPTVPTGSELVWEADTYGYIIDAATGERTDSFYIDPLHEMVNNTKEWYSPTVVYEIGRFITPYGIGLDLGPDGFRWIYDVTDYSHLLREEVELSAGNNQELIDLKFLFIKGDPPREVRHIKQIWGPRASYSYRSLDDDTELSETTVALHPEASQYKVKTRITGHGHSSNTGNYPHCCEWKDNTHFLYVNGEQAANWKIFQYTECGSNPLYPQGGTWPGAREGWCPGDLVKDFEFELGQVNSGNEIAFDYGITPVPSTNQGMGNGNYIMSMQLIQYGNNNRQTDAELYNIQAPNKERYYSRFNPSCHEALIEVRNNGVNNLTSLAIEYWLEGQTHRTYEWTGQIAPHQGELIALPLDDAFWKISGGESRFNVQISQPNGQADEYPENNHASSSFTYAPVYTEDIQISLTTNNRAFDNRLTITDVYGDQVYELSSLANNTTYNINLDLPVGCYTMELTDISQDGLYYWAIPQFGNGSLRIRKQSNGAILRDFEPEFGSYISYSFGLDNLTPQDNPTEVAERISLYPNPATDLLNIEVSGYEGEILMEIVDFLGRSVRQSVIEGDLHIELPVAELQAGSYLLKLKTDRGQSVRKFVVGN